MANFTLINGDEQTAFEEHPIETARKALTAAAEIEGPDWAGVMLRFASALPERGRMVRGRGDA
jgi:hypothetical protein